MIDEVNQAPLQKTTLETGIEIGKRQNQQQILIRQMQRKFGDIPAPILTQIEETDDGSQLDAWLDALLDADFLDDWALIKLADELPLSYNTSSSVYFLTIGKKI